MATLFDQGRVANTAGRPTEAERLLRRALQALDGGTRGAVRPEVDESPFPALGPDPASALEAWVRVTLSLSTAVVERQGPAAAMPIISRTVATCSSGSSARTARMSSKVTG